MPALKHVVIIISLCDRFVIIADHRNGGDNGGLSLRWSSRFAWLWGRKRMDEGVRVVIFRWGAGDLIIMGGRGGRKTLRVG